MPDEQAETATAAASIGSIERFMKSTAWKRVSLSVTPPAIYPGVRRGTSGPREGPGGLLFHP
jgi:hypothetical protein